MCGCLYVRGTFVVVCASQWSQFDAFQQSVCMYVCITVNNKPPFFSIQSVCGHGELFGSKPRCLYQNCACMCMFQILRSLIRRMCRHPAPNQDLRISGRGFRRIHLIRQVAGTPDPCRLAVSPLFDIPPASHGPRCWITLPEVRLSLACVVCLHTCSAPPALRFPAAKRIGRPPPISPLLRPDAISVVLCERVEFARVCAQQH